MTVQIMIICKMRCDKPQYSWLSSGVVVGVAGQRERESSELTAGLHRASCEIW